MAESKAEEAFLGEQPAECGSWKLRETQKMQNMNYNTLVDMCQFGLKDPESEIAMQKRTKLVHSSKRLHNLLNKRGLCPGKHKHQRIGGRTRYVNENGILKSIDRSKYAGWYTKEFCDAIIDGFAEEFSENEGVHNTLPVSQIPTSNPIIKRPGKLKVPSIDDVIKRYNASKTIGKQLVKATATHDAGGTGMMNSKHLM